MSIGELTTKQPNGGVFIFQPLTLLRASSCWIWPRPKWLVVASTRPRVVSVMVYSATPISLVSILLS